jgi:hypothetical protein
MHVSHRVKKSMPLLAALSLVLSGFMPLLSGVASAGQVTSRSLTLSTAQAGATNVSHTFGFNIATTGSIGSIELLYCTTPIGTCAAPAGLSVSSVANGNITTQTINGSAGGFTVGTNTANLIQLTRTVAGATAGNVAALAFSNITNPTTSTQTPAGNNSFYVRITTYSANNYTGAVDDGVVAAAIVPLLTITARVQEVLHFCVGSLLSTDTLATSDDCSTQITANGATVDLGPVANDGSTVTPVTVTGNTTTDERDGAIMMRTNANTGSTISYYSVANGGGTGGQLKKSGTTCPTGSNVAADACFDSTNAGAALAANTEWFGMRLLNTDGASLAGTSSLVATSPYDSVTNYTWERDPAAIDQVASATSAVDDEAFKLRFAAVTNVQTPTGQYSTSANFIAVATY